MFNPYFIPETSLIKCFNNATAFNQNIGSWDTSNVIDMSRMFLGAPRFNNGDLTNTGQNPLNWNTSKVTNMDGMFSFALAFNQQINASGNYWNTSKVTNMLGMFYEALVFNNGDLTNTGQNPLNWNTSKVTNMVGMFTRALAFNQNIGSWDTSNVTTMIYMFSEATRFKQDISSWSPYACTDMSNMFDNVDINNPNSATNQNNYNALLTSWGITKLSNMQPNVVFNAGLSKYTISVAGTAHSNLDPDKGWTITDGGGV
jgi:surface protein